jgi:hypothetical protein
MSFNDSVRALLGMVECRRAVDTSEKEAIYRLRYRAYSREGALPPGSPEIFRDRFDDDNNAATLGLYINGKLASSIRLHLATPRTPICPAINVFGDYVKPLIERGSLVLDPTRFVIDEGFARLFPKLPYVTLRTGLMAADRFRADYILATVRTEHQSFYRRFFGHRGICAGRAYPTLSKPISLMLLEFRKERNTIYNRYPFFNSDELEREQVFGDWLQGEAFIFNELVDVQGTQALCLETRTFTTSHTVAISGTMWKV